jgi:hypothetical protein
VYGGAPISTQERTLRRGVDVAVGTPGRIMDLMQRGALDLQEVRYMVLDEADQVRPSFPPLLGPSHIFLQPQLLHVQLIGSSSL